MLIEEPYKPSEVAYNYKPIEYELGGEKGECWICTSHKRSKHKLGRPQVKRNGKTIKISRYVYEIFNNKKLPITTVIRHTCDNVLCINPSHMLEGTQQDNIRDMVSRGRHARGLGSKSSRLSEKDVYEIKHLLKYTNYSRPQLGELYGISAKVVKSIETGRTWTHITI